MGNVLENKFVKLLLKCIYLILEVDTNQVKLEYPLVQVQLK